MTSEARTRQNRTLGIALIGLGIILVSGMLALLTRSSGATSIPKVGERLSDFTLSTFTGGEARLSDYAGHPVLINAWGSWCPPCRAEMPDLEAYYQAHKSDGLVILGVNYGDRISAVGDFLAQVPVSFPILLDQDGALMDRFGVRDYPTTIFVDRKGLVRAIHIGLFTPEAIEREITPLLSQ